MDRRAHWEEVYHTRAPDTVSWYQAEATLSRALIERLAPDRASRILDAGAGASVLVDALLASGYRDLTIVDVSPAALDIARRRLGAHAASVKWLEGDILAVPLPESAYDVWHDRAVFHFLTAPEERERYVARVRHAIRPGGLVLVATFAADGPTRCSGLNVERFSAESLHAAFGPDFELLETHRELHATPAGAEQAFTYCALRVLPPPPRPSMVTPRPVTPPLD